MKLDILQNKTDNIINEIIALRAEILKDRDASTFTPEGKKRSRRFFVGFNKVAFQLTSAIDSLNRANIAAEEYTQNFPDDYWYKIGKDINE